LRILVSLVVFTLFAGCAQQAPAPAGEPPAPAPQAAGNLAQVMRAIPYPASNVVFASQDVNPADVKPADPDPATSPNPLSSAYGGWQAVENAGIALSEFANLLTIPRKCMNGKDAPVDAADWKMWTQGLRDVGVVVTKAGQSKDQDMVLDAADKMTTACANCHDKYREKENLLDRCM
jgi:hypothetical protein